MVKNGKRKHYFLETNAEILDDTQTFDEGWERLCCANPVRDSSRESSMVAGVHEQIHIPDLQDQELASL